MASTAESDIDLHTLEENNAATENHPDSSRRYGYGGSLIQQYKFTIVCWIVSFALIIATIALGASSVQKSNEALALATINAEAMESKKSIIVNENGIGAESIGGGTPSIPNDSTPNPTPNPSPKPSTVQPTSVQPTGVPTEPHPFNPKWFQTTHSEYQSLVGLSSDTMHSNTIAASFCFMQDLWLCGYESYCPNGQGNDSFNGGPPKAHNWETLEQTQWAPFYNGDHSDIAAGKNWVQIGLIPASAEGTVENSFGKCSTFDDWYSGAEKDIEDKWEEKHTMWILCCEKAEEGEDAR